MNATEVQQLTEVEFAVYAAYLAVSRSLEWVPIARIYRRLRRYHPADVTDAIISFLERGKAQIAPQPNTQVLTAEDYATAIRLGNVDCHLICFED